MARKSNSEVNVIDFENTFLHAERLKQLQELTDNINLIYKAFILEIKENPKAYEKAFGYIGLVASYEAKKAELLERGEFNG